MKILSSYFRSLLKRIKRVKEVNDRLEQKLALFVHPYWAWWALVITALTMGLVAFGQSFDGNGETELVVSPEFILIPFGIAVVGYLSIWELCRKASKLEMQKEVVK